MQNTIALVREPGPEFVRALSTHPNRHAIDWELARQQHRAFTAALQTAGLSVTVLPPLPGFPDSVFVEDTAVLLEGKALLCPLRADGRRGETNAMQAELARFLPVEILQPPAFLDGGDVLQTDTALFVGQSQRTGPEAVGALARFTSKPVIPVTVKQGLHLKTSASYLGQNRLVLFPEAVDTEPFRNFDWIEVSDAERYAANCLRVGNHVILPQGYPDTARRIAQSGFKILPVPMSEFEKADGGVTCLSLLIPAS